MVFSSIPTYLDASNWHQPHQQQTHQIIGNTGTNHLLPPVPPPPPPPPHGAGGIGPLRPGSMAERARMANIPTPEAALKCPRCESTNTKFCYFNNYSLSQPRHFCKTCRRYWTRGGALRNVPVGGGCRRNKRTKSSNSSKSPASSDRQTNGANSSSTTTVSTTNSGPTTGLLGLNQHLAPLRFMSPLSQLTDSFTADMGLNYSGIAAPIVGTNEMNNISNYHVSNSNNLLDTWRLQQQFPFLGGLESSPAGIYQFHGGESSFMTGETSNQNQARPKVHNSSTLGGPVKMEDTLPQLNLSRQLIGGIQGNEQWNASGAPWNEL